jgi:hypothetical protein
MSRCQLKVAGGGWVDVTTPAFWLAVAAGLRIASRAQRSPWPMKRLNRSSVRGKADAIQRSTKWRRVCRMPGVSERLLVSSPSLCGVRAHRML